MGKIMMMGTQYGAGGITDAEDISYEDTTVKGALDDIKSGLIVKEQKSGTASFSGTNYAVASIDAAKTGYTPLGVVAFRGGLNTVTYRVSAIAINDNTIAVTVVNQTGAAETSNQTVTIDVLYKKN